MTPRPNRSALPQDCFANPATPIAPERFAFAVGLSWGSGPAVHAAALLPECYALPRSGEQVPPQPELDALAPAGSNAIGPGERPSLASADGVADPRRGAGYAARFF